MRRFVVLVLALHLSGAAMGQQAENHGAMSTAELIEAAPSAHPVALYTLSARLLGEGKGLEAAKWMYAGQLRYRFLIEALGDDARDERILFAALSESVGRPVNEYVAGDPDEWIMSMQWALDWDAAHENNLTSKSDFAAALARVRSGLERLIAQVDANRQQIRDARKANGLPNR